MGFGAATVASICAAASASNGSFFHHFGSKEGLAATLFINALEHYHATMLRDLKEGSSAIDGVASLVTAHLIWVTRQRRLAKFLFEQTRAEWLVHVREQQQAENGGFAARIEAWRAPLIAAGILRPMTPMLFISQVIGPAQILCRAWLSGRTTDDPRRHAEALIECAVRALVDQSTTRPKRTR